MYVMSSKIFEKGRPTEKLGEQDVLLAPPITLLGEQLLPLLPLFPRLCWSITLRWFVVESNMIHIIVAANDFGTAVQVSKW